MTEPRSDSATKASSNSFQRQVSLYSIAAAMAGVSVMSLAAPAAGEVVVTKKTIPIPLSVTLPSIGVSISNNGVNDFSFSLASYPVATARLLFVGGANPSNKVVERSFFYAKALALPRGASIGPRSPIGYGGLVEETQSSRGGRGIVGYWGNNPENRYLGVRFQLQGQTHYGWIRLTVVTDPNSKGPLLSAKITGYAYETVPNKPILAGTAAGTARAASSSSEKASAEVQSPSKKSGPSLGMLAGGADALPIWRRE